jgi:hypothetical protein
MLMVKGILRMGVGRYGLELRRSILESLSDIYYRMNFCNVIMSGGTLIAGKIAVQVDVKRDARAFSWCWRGGVGKSRLVSLFSYPMGYTYWLPC